MKIKTVWQRITEDRAFDQEVNELTEKGWRLIKREVLPTTTDRQAVLLYAELVLPDPPAEPEPFDPLDLVSQLRAFCDGVPKKDCEQSTCPLAPYCDAMATGKAIDEWPLPEEVADL